MNPIVLDTYSRGRLNAQRAEVLGGVAAPLRWFGLLDQLSRAQTGVGAAERDWRRAVIGQGCLVVSNVSHEAVATALSSQALVYLCWGLPQRGWKRQIIAGVLRRARHVLVNDETTGKEIEESTGRAVDIVPYFVDTQFFSYCPLEGRLDFLFCNGTNDRDCEVVVGLARRGFKIVWLVNDFSIYQRYDGVSCNLKIRSRISHSELRELNQTCAAAIMPIVADRHCAGQTTGLEAIACGAPLLITSGRTASIFSGLTSVVSIEGNSIDRWESSVTKVLQDTAKLESALTRRKIEQRLSPTNIGCILAPFFGWPAQPLDRR